MECTTTCERLKEWWVEHREYEGEMRAFAHHPPFCADCADKIDCARRINTALCIRDIEDFINRLKRLEN